MVVYRIDLRMSGSVDWTPDCALQHYLMLAERFDVAHFTGERAPNFKEIPWPTLCSPDGLGFADIEWADVEVFLVTVKGMISATAYKALVKDAVKRFHPDTWTRRRILPHDMEKEQREAILRQVLKVAEVLVPTYMELNRE